MSGGHFNYCGDRVCMDMFDGEIYADYGFNTRGDYKDSVKVARNRNPMEDKELSELVYDVMCLIHSLDWYVSGDTNEDVYRKDVEFFKKKWFGKDARTERLKEIVIESSNQIMDELIRMIDGGES